MGVADFSVAGKVALVTGAARGIGKATALALARHGADVAVNYLSQKEKAQGVVEAIRTLGRRSVAVQGDVSKEGDVKRLVREAIQTLGPIDILVNNAGIASSCRFQEMSLAEWQRTIDVDLTSVFLVTRELVPSMIERRAGRIMAVRAPAQIAPEIAHLAKHPETGTFLLWTRGDARDCARACRLAIEREEVASGVYNITGGVVLSETSEQLVRRYFGDRTEMRASLKDHESPLSCAKAEAAFGYRPTYLWSETRAYPEE
jgi:NAD(P)-dependent dehydrogenase (short-subunit alcohol dehydrogenase family)